MNLIYIGTNTFKRSLFFRINADFEADNEIGKSSIRNKVSKIFKQNPVPNGYYIVTELDYVLKSGQNECPVGYNIVDWFVDEVIMLEIKTTFCFKNNNKDNMMTEEDGED